MNNMLTEQLLLLPQGNQIPVTNLLAKTNTHLLNPTELDRHGCKQSTQTVRGMVEMDTPEGQEATPTELQCYRSQVLRGQRGQTEI